mgnify:CR=1 FL=1
MNPSSINGPANLVQQLIDTLHQELALFAELEHCLEAQLGALRQRSLEALEEAAMATSERLTRLERLEQTRLRQGRLLRRILGLDPLASGEQLLTAVAALPEGASAAQTLRQLQQALQAQQERARRQCETLEFSLQYAIRIGQELLEFLQELEQPATARIYTPTGRTTQAAPPHPVVNQVG